MGLPFLYINGISLLFIAMLELSPGKDYLIPLVPILLILLSFPHFMMTYVVWFSRIKNWKTELWPLAFPFIYCLVFFGTYYSGSGLIDIALLVKLSYCYLLYHFAQQLYGTNLWLSYSQGTILSNLEKWIFKSFVLICAFYGLLVLELNGSINFLFYYSVPLWPIPSSVITGSFVLCSCLFLVLLSMRLRSFYKNARVTEIYPLVGYSVGLFWFFPPFTYNIAIFLPLIHALQYAPFLMMKLKHKDRKVIVGLFAFAILSGYLFFKWLPFYAPLAGMPSPVWAAFILTLLNNHHFIIDGRIWKLRDEANKDLWQEAKA